jgi:SET domain-containing protein
MTMGNPKCVVKRSSTGLGLFAARLIPAGKRIIEYTGRLITNEEVERRKNGKYFFGVDAKYSIDGSERGNIARYINHSCRPNAEAYVAGKRVWIWSKREIKPGEEITYNYGKEYFDDHIKPVGCKCEKCTSKPTKKRRRYSEGATESAEDV